MKMKTRIGAFWLAVLMVGTLLAGCGNTDASSAASSGAVSSAPTASEPAKSPEVVTPAEPIAEYKAETYYGDMSNPYGPMTSGLTSVDVVSKDDPNIKGKIVVYVPETSHPCVDQLLVLVPDGVTAEEMAQTAQWNQVGDEEEICIVYIEAPNGSWNLDAPEDDIAFIRVALQDFVASKLFVVANERATYMIGYGSGGTMAHQYAMAYPARLSGVVSVGGSAVTDAYMDAVGNSPSYAYAEANYTGPYEEWPNNTIPVPAWIINCGDSDANKNVVEYWKNANNVVDEGLENAYGKVYQADKVTANQLNNEQNIAEVWVSDIADAMTYDVDFNSSVWTDFFSRVRRFVGDPGGSLRAAYEPEDVGMTRHTIEVDGLERLFYMYTPSTYDGSQDLPLVVAIHGYSSTARAFTTDTEWWRVAENRGLIVAFVQAYPHEGYPTYGGNVPHWITNNTRLGLGNGPEEQEMADIHFIEAVLDFASGNYSVDESRRYVTGHSNGGMMTCNIIDEIPELFAAAAPIGGLDVCWSNDQAAAMANYSDDVKLPVYGMAGDLEFGNGFDDNESIANQMTKWLSINSMDADDALKTRNKSGRFDTVTYYDGAAPMVKFSYVDNSPHAYFPEEAWKVWDEFFSKYSRAEDGMILYEGAKIG